jgi:hypothetical protein
LEPDRLVDRSILDPLELGRREASGGIVLTRRQQGRRAEQAADDVAVSGDHRVAPDGTPGGLVGRAG